MRPSRDIMMAWRVSLALIASMFLCNAVSAQADSSPQTAVPQQASLQDAAAMLGQRYDDLYGRKDAAGMAGLYAADGELVSPGGKIVTGREALEAYYRDRFASGATGHKITVLETHAVGDTGYSVAAFSVSAPSAAHPSERHVEQGHIAAVYAHDETGWHFALVEPSVTPGG